MFGEGEFQRRSRGSGFAIVLRRLLVAGAGLIVVACGPAQLPAGDVISDPDEAQNRATHELNLALDRAVVAPVAEAYGETVPAPVRTGISNFASNLNQPSYVVNNLLQARLGDAVTNSLRFAVNSTVGIGGLFDPATAIGLNAEETDFGETLHLYGLPEGDYAVLPVLGPSTGRDAVGRLVDFALNPVRYFVEAPESRYVTGARVASGLNARHQFGGTVDSILNESTDSYSQLRSLYVQQRRFDLAGPDLGLGYEDPYSSGEGDQDQAQVDPSYDASQDQYYDPYAQ